MEWLWNLKITNYITLLKISRPKKKNIQEISNELCQKLEDEIWLELDVKMLSNGEKKLSHKTVASIFWWDTRQLLQCIEKFSITD